jgi:hypothetical protein
MDMKVDHIGVPTTKPKEGETWISETRVWVTPADNHPFRIEWLRFADDSPCREEIKSTAHIAYKVKDFHKAIEGKNVILGPFVSDLGDHVAFILTEDGAVVEFMEDK